MFVKLFFSSCLKIKNKKMEKIYVEKQNIFNACEMLLKFFLTNSIKNFLRYLEKTTNVKSTD